MDNKKSFEKVEEFLNGISFNRIETDFDMLGEMGKTLLSLIFTSLIKEMGKDNIINMSGDSRLLRFIKFFMEKK
jgi:hypothetical protein